MHDPFFVLSIVPETRKTRSGRRIYVIPRLKQVENVEDEMPTNFQIEIIDRLSKKTDKELDEAIKG